LPAYWRRNFNDGLGDDVCFKEINMKSQPGPNFRERLRVIPGNVGTLLVDAFHYGALFAIGATIAWSAFGALLGMVEHGRGSIDDILLLFIYLELGAMVGIYFKTNHMPVRFLLYVAMTALTHHMISVVQSHDKSTPLDMLVISCAMLVLAIAILVIRYGSSKFPVQRGSTEAL
jgi:phosphate starvation-inducible membrane PsiE